MSFLNWIIDDLTSASNFFYQIYLEVYGWVYPFYLTASWFYQLSSLFASLSWDFYYFSLWVMETSNKLLEILSWSTIQSYITSWFYYLGDLSVLFYYFWQNVTNVITNWWYSTSLIVEGWIAEVKDELNWRINNTNSWLGNIASQWNAFTNKIPSLDEIISWFTNWYANVLYVLDAWWASTMRQVQSLIDSAFLIREPFWAGWQDWKDSLIEFIQDPWGWLYDRVEDLFDRFW